MLIDSLNKKILHIAIPAIVSNVTVPLLGLVDTGIAGHLGQASYIGAIAVGSVIFNTIFWLFSFLRWGTSGLTSQALGCGDSNGVSYTLYRSLVVAMVISVSLIVLQYPIFWLSTFVIAVDSDVAVYVSHYFYICIWGAVAVQTCYALNGWFVGMQNSRIPMTVAIVQNLTNIPLSLLFVYGLGMKVEGIALGTVIAQYIGLAVALWLLRRQYGQYLIRPEWNVLFVRADLLRFLSVNRDIMLRMVCLLSVTVWFTSVSARQGAVVLAANTILQQLFYFFSFFFDGFANAGEALCGKCWGGRDLVALKKTVGRVFCWGMLLVVLFTAVYYVAERPLLQMLSDQGGVIACAMRYFGWLLLVPVCGVQTFVWDGVFIGTTSTRLLLLSMVVATVVFFASYMLLFPLWGNDGLWLSFLLYLLGRGVTQTLSYPKLIGRCPQKLG